MIRLAGSISSWARQAAAEQYGVAHHSDVGNCGNRVKIFLLQKQSKKKKVFQMSLWYSAYQCRLEQNHFYNMTIKQQ